MTSMANLWDQGGVGAAAGAATVSLDALAAGLGSEGTARLEVTDVSDIMQKVESLDDTAYRVREEVTLAVMQARASSVISALSPHVKIIKAMFALALDNPGLDTSKVPKAKAMAALKEALGGKGLAVFRAVQQAVDFKFKFNWLLVTHAKSYVRQKAAEIFAPGSVGCLDNMINQLAGVVVSTSAPRLLGLVSPLQGHRLLTAICRGAWVAHTRKNLKPGEARKQSIANDMMYAVMNMRASEPASAEAVKFTQDVLAWSLAKTYITEEQATDAARTIQKRLVAMEVTPEVLAELRKQTFA
jgi:hypothetical protein